MADFYEISAASGISVRALKRLEKLGFLRVGASENPIASKIRYGLARGNPLSVAMLADLLADEKLVFALGKYEDKAAAAIRELGNVQGELAGADIVAAVEGAAVNEPQAVARLVEWMKATIPAHGDVSHQFLAVRIVMATRESFRSLIINRVALAFLNCRNAPALAGWFTVRQHGKGQSVTIYHKGPNLALDL
jgi:hypothetical protein